MIFQSHWISIEVAARKFLKEPDNLYLIEHYRKGDTGVIGWVAGAISSEVKNFTIEARKSVVREVLDDLVQRRRV